MAAAGERRPDGAEPGVRIGLHTGESEEVATGYVGAAVYLALAVAAAGHGGQTLASGATAGLLDRSDLHDLGWFSLDGVPGDLRIIQIGAGEYAPIRLTGIRRGRLPRRVGRLIGRDEQLAAYKSTLGAQ